MTLKSNRYLSRDVNDASKVQGWYHKAQVKKNCDAKAKFCEAKARNAV